ncbi:replication-relaxation family protein [Nocardia aobensis]|uniref:Replication-relaxation family protein n=1 Tax=Nocardia aobensis TaxID=257277 RepID=A0ABW6NWV5_9NOCA
MTTDQIASLEFASVRRAQDRLRKLREMGMLFAFRESLYGGGTTQTRHALGYLGARLIAAQRAQTPPAPAKYALSLERLACSPMLTHRLGVNGFFCALAAHRNPTRHNDPVAPDSVQGLTQWWSERQCAEMFWTNASGEDQLHPDGYGCWEHGGRTVRFFLEYDAGTESLKTVASKLADYQGFPTDKFGILLFSVHSARRETGLRAAPSRTFGSYPPGLVIATISRDLAHPDGPAGPVWALWTAQRGDAVVERLRLAELPERGPRIAHHTSTEQPSLRQPSTATNPRSRPCSTPTRLSPPLDTKLLTRSLRTTLIELDALLSMTGDTGVDSPSRPRLFGRRAWGWRWAYDTHRRVSVVRLHQPCEPAEADIDDDARIRQRTGTRPLHLCWPLSSKYRLLQRN